MPQQAHWPSFLHESLVGRSRAVPLHGLLPHAVSLLPRLTPVAAPHSIRSFSVATGPSSFPSQAPGTSILAASNLIVYLAYTLAPVRPIYATSDGPVNLRVCSPHLVAVNTCPATPDLPRPVNWADARP